MHLIFNIVWLRLKLINRNKEVLLLNFFIAVFLLVIIGSLYEESESVNTLRIAYVDENNSKTSKAIIENLENSQLLDPFSVGYNEGMRLLKNGEVDVMFVMDEDVDEHIKDQEYEELATIYYVSGNFLAPMIGELIGASFMGEIAFDYAIDTIERVLYDRENINEIVEDAYGRGEEGFLDKKENYYVDIEFIDIENEVAADESSIGNELFYKQIVLGVVLTFIGFYLLFVGVNIVKDKEIKIAYKISMTKTNTRSLIIGEYISIIISSLFIIVLGALLNGFNSDDFFKGFCQNFLVLFLYVLAYSALILFFAKVLNKVSSYIVVGSALVFIVGIVSGSFFFIDLSIPVIRQLALLTPPYHALNQILNIIGYKSILNLGDYLLYTIVFSAFFLFISIPLFKKNRNKI